MNEDDSFLTGKFVKISFHMEMGCVQLCSCIPFIAKDMCDGVAKTMEMDSQSVTADSWASNSGNPAGPSCICATQASQQMAYRIQHNGQPKWAADTEQHDGKCYK